jgi:dihydropyrimidinase
LSRLLFTGGCIESADDSFRADVPVADADADIVLWDPALQLTATVDNRHGNADYTLHEGMSFHGGPASVYVRGNLVYRDGEVIGERGSGKFVERSFNAANVEVKV